MIRLSFIVLILSIVFISLSFYRKKGKPNSSIHQFQVKTIDGNVFDFSTLKGKKILIVNTANKCGFTPQFKQLEELYQLYGHKNFTIIGFPCNQFGQQDPGSDKEIKEFCTKNYGASFTMMEKINVKGDSISEIYKWLTSKDKNGVMSSSVKWNFQKYMIDENGFLVDYLLSFRKPNCTKIVSWIEGK
ncbi:MAG: glutathione peroxidase [Bacteroidota bacterium]